MAEKKKGEKSGVLVTPKGQFVFKMHVYEPDAKDAPNASEFADDKYKATHMIEVARKEELLPIKKEMLAIAKKAWGDSVKYQDLEVPFRDGTEAADDYDAKAKKDGKKDDVGKMDKLRGMIYYRAKSTRKPKGVVGPDKKALPDGENVEGGDFGRMSIVAHTYVREAQYPKDGKIQKVEVKGVGFWLQNIMKLKTGDRFGGTSGEEDFRDTPVDPLDLEQAQTNGTGAKDETFDDKAAPASKGKEAVETTASNDDIF